MANATDLYLNLILPKNTVAAETLAEIAAKIALHNFKWQYVTLVFYNCTIFCGVDVFNQMYGKTVIVGKGSFSTVFAEEIRQYVVVGYTVIDIKQVLNHMQQKTFDNTGNHIVFCISQGHNDCNETDAVATFWHYKVVNVVFIKIFNGGEVAGYTFFHPKDCVSAKPVKLDNFEVCMTKNVNCTKMFPTKFFNLNGCPLIASTFVQPPYMKLIDGKPGGSDGEIILIVAAKLNATLKMMTPRHGRGWGQLNENGTWIGSLSDLYYDYANLSITSAAITTQRFIDFQISINYDFSTVGWVTHPTESQPSSLKLLHPFSPNVHIVIMVIFFLITVFSLLTTSKLWDDFLKTMNLSWIGSNIIYYSWLISMGLPINKLPRKSIFLCIVLMWIWYAFVIRAIYQSSLINSLMNDYKTTNVETVKDMINANYRVGGGPALMDYYRDFPLVTKDWVSLNPSGINTTMLEISKGLKFGLACNLEYTHIFYNQYKIRLHVLSEKVVVTPTVIFFKKFSPLARPVNDVLRRLTEGGFPRMLLKKHAKREHDSSSTERNEPINIEQYAGCYTILLLGWTLSFVCFIYEICLQKFKRKQVATVVSLPGKI